MVLQNNNQPLESGMIDEYKIPRIINSVFILYAPVRRELHNVNHMAGCKNHQPAPIVKCRCPWVYGAFTSAYSPDDDSPGKP